MRILIADDEEGPREQLRTSLAHHWPQAQLVAVCEHGADAWDSFLEHEPDACFLDIRMPGLSGIEVAQRIVGTGLPCALVFCTAYNDHATQAFDAGAIDYLLKPLSADRFAQAVERVKQRLALKHATQALPASLVTLLSQQPQAPRLRTLQASVGKEVRLIQIDDVVFFEADTRYTRVVYSVNGQDAEALIRTPLKELLVGLNPEQFWQIHRSTIVNTQHMHSAVRVDESNMVLTLRGRAERLPVSRHFQGLFKGS